MSPIEKVLTNTFLTSTIIITTGLAYIIHGLSIIIIYPPIETTVISSVLNWVGYPTLVGVVFIVAGVLGICGIKCKNSKCAFVLFSPLLAFVLYSAINSIVISFYGQYPNGYIPNPNPKLFILNDQLSGISGAIFYILAVWKLSWTKVKTK